MNIFCTPLSFFLLVLLNSQIVDKVNALLKKNNPFQIVDAVFSLWAPLYPFSVLVLGLIWSNLTWPHLSVSSVGFILLHTIFISLNTHRLGDKAAKQGAGKFDKEMCCMQKFIADQAFKTAMKDRNIDGAAAAIKFAGLERNTLGIGVKSLECTDTASMSPEIASIIHHQVCIHLLIIVSSSPFVQ